MSAVIGQAHLFVVRGGGVVQGRSRSVQIRSDQIRSGVCARKLVFHQGSHASLAHLEIAPLVQQQEIPNTPNIVVRKEPPINLLPVGHVAPNFHVTLIAPIALSEARPGRL